MDSELLKYYAAKSGYTLTNLSKVLGINASTLSRKLSGETDFTRSEIVLLKECLHLSLSEVDLIFFTNELA